MTQPYHQDDTTSIYTGETLAVLTTIPTGSVAAVIADPPYSSGALHTSERTRGSTSKYQSSDAKTRLPNFEGDNRDGRSYGYWTALWLAECLRITEPGGIAVVFSDWRQLPTTTDGLQAGGWVWRGVMPWHKPGARPQRGRFTAACEYMVWGTNGRRPPDALDGRVLPGWFSERPPSRRAHIAQKPVEVMRELVQCAPEGSTVLDPFCGSGTTGVACALENRRFIGIEKAQHFADVTVERITAAKRSLPI